MILYLIYSRIVSMGRWCTVRYAGFTCNLEKFAERDLSINRVAQDPESIRRDYK